MAESEIDPQELIDLVEGRLNPAERSSLMGRIAASPEHVESLAELIRERDGWDPDHAAAWEREEQLIREAPLGGGRPSSGGRAPRLMWWAAPAAAAAIVAALVVPRLLRDRATSDALTHVGSRDLTLLLDSSGAPTGTAWDQPPWTVARGATRLSPDTVLAVRLGARLVDLQLARMMGDTAAERRVRGDRDSMIVMLPASQSLAELFEAADREADADVRARLENAAERRLGERVDGYHLLRGKWLRTAYWAAQWQNADFFESELGVDVFDELSRRGGIEWNGVPARGAPLDSSSLVATAARIRELLAQRE